VVLAKKRKKEKNSTNQDMVKAKEPMKGEKIQRPQEDVSYSIEEISNPK